MIRAFYNDEGNVSKNGDYIRLFQDNNSILVGFRDLLKEFGIEAAPIKMYLKKDKKRYYFNLYKKSNFIKFNKEIGFTSKIKMNRLKKATVIKNFKNSM